MRPYGEKEAGGQERGQIKRVGWVKSRTLPWGGWEFALRIADAGCELGYIISREARDRHRRIMKKAARQALKRELAQELEELG